MKKSMESKTSRLNVQKRILPPPHPDLTKAVQGLDAHAILLGEFIPTAKIKELGKIDAEILQAFHVSGFSVSEKGVILSAQKTLKSGKMMGYNTPLVVFEDDSENSYPFMEQLKTSIDKCCEEFAAYLGGKYKDDGQGKLFEE